jgi:pimeloyl-ACP methyl ester carboxylesterase
VAFLEVDGVRLEHEWHGPAPATATLVFLHEGLGSVAAWRDFPARVADATGCRAFVYSRRGYGHSDPLPGPLDPSFMHEEARCLPAVLHTAGIREPILIGHSDGASIALLHAAEAAAEVRGLVAIAPHVFVEPETLAGIREVGERYRATDFRTRWRRTQGEHADRTFEAWSRVWLSPEFRSWNIESRLGAVRCPILAVQGEGDAYGTPRQVEAIRRAAAGPVRVVLLPDCGHSPQRDRPAETLEAVRGFVAGLERPSFAEHKPWLPT